MLLIGVQKHFLSPDYPLLSEKLLLLPFLHGQLLEGLRDAKQDTHAPQNVLFLLLLAMITT